MKSIKLILLHNTSKLKYFFRYKDILPNRMQAGVIYKFSCSGCNSAYVVITSQYLRTRACEHLGMSALMGAAIKTSFSSRHDHLLKTGYNANLDDFSILFKSHDQSSLTIWKNIYIKKHRPNLNIQNDAVIFDLIC